MPENKVAIIACGVLEWNLERVRERFPDREIILRVLPAQLHNNPQRLRELLQEAIDDLDGQEGLSGIGIGYGLCGRGTVGLYARGVPLILPRVQDCIGFFLGSHGRHMEQFKRFPGTRYLTHGWYEKTMAARPSEQYHTKRNDSLYGSSFDELRERYGDENARFIRSFRESWKRNYRRAAYIEFAGEDDGAPGRRATQALADELGWKHDVLAGDESLFEAMAGGHWSDPRLLVVPPGNKTVSAPGESVFGFSAGVDQHVEDILRRFEEESEVQVPRRSGIGLGIDTGGTYTDAVVYDFDNDRVLAQAKSETTHDRLIEGIRNVLAPLPGEALSRVSRVGLSTTLATNAFVENKGRPVALLLMSRFAVDESQLPFRFVRLISGGMSIDGIETEPIDDSEIRTCARQALTAGCEAIAVSGFGSVINPIHEQSVARIAFEETGLHAVCGHELTSELNFVERATTAAMNAKLIPLIETLIDAVSDALRAHGLGDVRIMVVKGDGSQLLAEVARSVPVETVLSGPAASVVGASRLCRGGNAVVVDMGGTTLDAAVLRDGYPELSDRGARVGDFRTSVRAMAAQTVGLGGDSEIDLSNWPAVRIGPRRIIPVCRLAETQPKAADHLADALQDAVSRVSNATDIVAVAPGADPHSDRLLAHLTGGPLLLSTLARRMNRPSPDYIPWHALESRGVLRRYGLTLTDVLHIQQRFNAFDGHLSARMLNHWCLLLEVDQEEILERILHEFRRMVIDTVLQVTLPGDAPWSRDGALRRWLTAHMADRPMVRDVSVRPELSMPLIAVGAPASALFPDLQAQLGSAVVVSEHASVANAVGAIAGDVMLRETAVIRVRDDGAFLCSWRGGSSRAADLHEALEICRTALQETLSREARANQVPYVQPAFAVVRQEAQTRDGTLFMGVTMQAEMRG